MDSNNMFNSLRKKLEALGYHQPLPGIALVAALFQDLIITTKSLRDCKLKVDNLLEEQSCWKLGVEPYKCDNAKLLTKTNELQLKIYVQKEQFEQQIFELQNKMRNLEADKRFLDHHCTELEEKLGDIAVKYSSNKLIKNEKPAFVTTVKSGIYLGKNIDENFNKCKPGTSSVRATNAVNSSNMYENERIQNIIRQYSEQQDVDKAKILTRDREINRLNGLLSGGRTSAALAKDCCYKNVGALTQDLEILQQEKAQNLETIREYLESMHEAKERATDLFNINKRLKKELNDIKITAQCLENEANEEIFEREKRIEELQDELRKCKLKFEHSECSNSESRKMETAYGDKIKSHARLNENTLREQEHQMQKRIKKLESKITAMQKENWKNKCDEALEEEQMRLKSERDFFQKEYLSLIHKIGSDKDINFLQSQIKSKDAELTSLRSELSQLRHLSQNQTDDRYEQIPSLESSSSMKAAFVRVEREKQLLKDDLHRLKLEKDTVCEQLKNNTEVHLQESHNLLETLSELKFEINALKKEKKQLEINNIPEKTHVVLMKEEIEELKKSIYELQIENHNIQTSYKQIKILHEQTEKALIESQNKCASIETQLENTTARHIHRDSSRNEADLLNNEIIALKSINNTIENEKDKALVELDKKTEKMYKLESDLKALSRRNKELEITTKEIIDKYEKITSERRENENKLQDSSYECKNLRQEVTVLKVSKDEAVSETNRILHELSECHSEVAELKMKLKNSEKEIEQLHKQLTQYVSEVKKAEELLSAKEKERDEMLEHYRCLSHDAVLLEGNNQSLEIETTEYKRMLCDAESEIAILKAELSTKNGVINKLERQISCLSSQSSSLEKQLEQAYDDNRLIKVDLDASKELCDKLDVQTNKLNAELEELEAIRTKLERENERLRRNGDLSKANKHVPAETLEKLLDKTRYELEDAQKFQRKLSQEVNKLKEKNVDLEINLEREREKCTKNHSLAKEYSIQLHELRHTLTDNRFLEAQNRQQSPRFPTL